MIQLWTLGVIVNFFLFYSIFDIHFKSPIVQVNRRHRLDSRAVKAPFKRVVFFTADGLRAETFKKFPEYRPYLTKLIENENCVWGVSDTRVPTESRPGHVALFAGFYEDPSAVFNGWKENTVKFDTIFNQTSYSIGLGSPDIVPMFAKGLARDKMYMDTYTSEWQEFNEYNAGKTNNWVMDYLENMIRNQSVPKGKEILIFLHLLSTDTIGHASKPQSQAYLDQMKVVDSIVKRTQKLVEAYFNDDDTLFVLTADHGMTDWGSHGDGSAHETETPYVIWGKGIRGAIPESRRLHQADFAALLAGALGVGYPSNSLGRFPTSIWTDQTFAFEALKANLHQIFDLMMTKKQLVESNRNLAVIKFEKEDVIKGRLNEASSEDLDFNINNLNEAINWTMTGILYYDRYDETLLIIFVVFSTICWMVIVGSIIILMSMSYSDVKTMDIVSAKLALVAAVSSAILIKVLIGWSLWRLPYGFFPVYLVLLLSKLCKSFGIRNASNENDERNLVVDGELDGRVRASTGSGKSLINSLFLLLVFSAIGVEILANSYDSRGVLSLGLVLNAIWCTRAKKVSSWQKTLFFVAVAALAVFPLMPVIGKKRNPLFVTLGPLMSVLLVNILLYFRRKESYKTHIVVGFQLVLLFSVPFLSLSPSQFLTRIIAWTSLVLSYFLPIFVSAETVALRLISLFLGIATPFSFICFSYEALFLPCLFLVLFILLKLEMSGENLEDSWTDFLTLSSESRERRKLWEKVDLHEAVRRAWLHLFFVTLAFFGTGNIASVNSFDPSSTKCFVTVFRPWIMMLVLIEKILGPFLLVSCFFRKLLWSRFQVERSFLIVLLLCQGMSLHTFFKVKNVGSWLEIGTSISHHVITNATTLCLFILHFIADFIMSFEPWPTSARSTLNIPAFHDNRHQKHL